MRVRGDDRSVRALLGGALGALFCALVLVTFLFSATAQAIPLVRSGTFGALGSAAGQLANPQALAVDERTGDVYVADAGNNRIDKFDAQGNFILAFGKGVDQTTGGDICTAASGDTCQAGTAGHGAGQLTSPAFVAVDNSAGLSAGDVYVGDTGQIETGAAVSKFNGSGNYISSINGIHLGTRPGSIAGVAVDPSGNLWLSLNETEVFLLEFGQSGEFLREWRPYILPNSGIAAVDASHVFFANERYSTSGVYQGEITEGIAPTGFALDPVTDDLYVDNGGTVIEHYDSSCAPVSLPPSGQPTGVGCQPIDSFGTGGSALTNLALNASTTTLYAVDGAAGQIVIFLPPPAGPSVIASEFVSRAGSADATVNATITPRGLDASCRVQYIDDAAFQTAGYTGVTAVACDPSDLGSGFADQAASASLTGLTPGVKYHYRFLIANSAGTAAGASRTFTAEIPVAGLPDARSYEMTTPPNKDSGEPFLVGNAEDEEFTEGFGGDAAVDGARMAFGSLDVLPGSLFSGASYLSTRGGGWSTENVIPPQSKEEGAACTLYAYVQTYSSDLSKAVLVDGARQPECGHDDPMLVAGEPQGVQNLFVRDNAHGTYQLVSLNPIAGSPAEANFDGASTDLGHVIFDESAQLTADAPPASDNLYDWSNGGVHLVTVLPDGTPTSGSLVAVSADGSKIFFRTGGNLYMRANDARTVQVDAPQGAGPGGAGQFAGASSNGLEVFLTDDASAGLTSDTVPGSGLNLYSFEVETGKLTDITASSDASVQSVVGTAEDGSYVYFVATGDLASGATTGQSNLYLYHEGATTFILDSSAAQGGLIVSADGTHIAFESERRLTGVDTAGFAEIYLYDSRARSLVCASCSPRGVKTTGQARLNRTRKLNLENGGSYTPRDLSADGSRLFFDSSQALVAGGGNGRESVYEYEQSGTGSCQTTGGCIYLISSRKGTENSYFVNASASGNDVFFGTRERLLAQDTDGSTDIYDARVNGSPSPPPPLPPCGGESCRLPTTPPPSSPSAASATFLGTGNLAAPIFKPAAKPGPSTRVQKLTRALSICRRKPRKQRHGCEALARKRYGPRSKAGKSNHRSSLGKGAK